jgi:hypothetical protein
MWNVSAWSGVSMVGWAVLRAGWLEGDLPNSTGYGCSQSRPLFLSFFANPMYRYCAPNGWAKLYMTWDLPAITPFVQAPKKDVGGS